MLQAESPGWRPVHQSRCVVVHFQHLSHESRGEATVGLLRFLFITTFYSASVLLVTFIFFLFFSFLLFLLTLDIRLHGGKGKYRCIASALFGSCFLVSLASLVFLFLGKMGSATKQGWRYPGWDLLFSYSLIFAKEQLLVRPLENCMCT
jgi:hypothetical protein